MKLFLDNSWLFHKCHYVYSFKNSDLNVAVPFGILKGQISLDKYNFDQYVYLVDGDDISRGNLKEDYKDGRGDKTFLYSSKEDTLKLLSLHPKVKLLHHNNLEADDLFSIVTFSRPEDEEYLLYCDDNDMLQLLPFGVKLANKINGSGINYKGDDYIKKHKKFPGCDSKHILLFRSITGDSGDNIKPVVPRIPKTFVLDFCRKWYVNGSLSTTLDEFSHTKYGARLYEVKDKIVENYKVMDLLKWRKKKWKWQQFDVTKNYQINSEERDFILKKYNLEYLKRSIHWLNG